MTDIESTWCDNATRWGGTFVSTFAKACFCADDANYRLLRPLLKQLIKKYPFYKKGAK